MGDNTPTIPLLNPFGTWQGSETDGYASSNYGLAQINPEDDQWMQGTLAFLQELGAYTDMFDEIVNIGCGPAINVSQLVIPYLHRDSSGNPCGRLWAIDVVPSNLRYHIKASSRTQSYVDQETGTIVDPQSIWRKFDGRIAQIGSEVYGPEEGAAFYNTYDQLAHCVHAVKGSIFTLPKRRFGLAIEAFVAYAITKNLCEVYKAWQKVIESVTSGGYAIFVGFLHSAETYPAGNNQYPATNLSEDQILNFLKRLKEMGLIIDYRWATTEPESEEEKARPGYEKMYYAVIKVA